MLVFLVQKNEGKHLPPLNHFCWHSHAPTSTLREIIQRQRQAPFLTLHGPYSNVHREQERGRTAGGESKEEVTRKGDNERKGSQEVIEMSVWKN